MEREVKGLNDIIYFSTEAWLSSSNEPGKIYRLFVKCWFSLSTYLAGNGTNGMLSLKHDIRQDVRR
jgi:hypothetical protein